MTKNPFLQSIRERFGSCSSEFADAFLQAAGLPLPEKGQFYQSMESDVRLPKVILFLHPHKIALRFYEPLYIPPNDHILQPLVKFEADFMDVDIVPIVPVGIKGEDLRILQKTLEEEGIGWGDPATHNAGYAQNGSAHPVVTDICESIQYVGHHLGLGNDWCKVQDKIFGSFQTKARDWLDGEGLPKARLSEVFPREQSGILQHAGMLTKDFVRAEYDHPQTIRAYHGALNYALQIPELACN